MSNSYTLIAVGLMPALALAACQTITPVPADPQVASLANTIQHRADTFYTALAAEPAPGCTFDAHVQDHEALAALAAQLQNRLATTGSSKALRRAAQALTSAITNARESHRLASAVTTDPSGPCLAPGALRLNHDAIARASAAIAASQQR